LTDTLKRTKLLVKPQFEVVSKLEFTGFELLHDDGVDDSDVGDVDEVHEGLVTVETLT
jgi:hypothetical protein